MEYIANKIVAKEINNWDSMDLLAGGAPDDKYEGEIATITKVLVDCKDEIELGEAIKETFDYAFQIDLNFEYCIKAAKKIWKSSYE